MSDQTLRNAPQTDLLSRSCDAIERVIEPRMKDLDGFSVRRVLPSPTRRMVGPWIFFDHLGPVEFCPGDGVNVRPHPHINLATVTYLFEGEIFHRDALGSAMVIRPGDINLMIAGRGITHSERERPEVRGRLHRLHALQLWLALPEADEEMEPAFYHYEQETLPRDRIDGVEVRVLMGAAFGLTSPVKTLARTLYLEARLDSGQALVLPQEDELAFYSVEGALEFEGVDVGAQQMVVLAPGQAGVIRARDACRVVVIGGEALGPRHIEWNFVSSRRERIEAAKAAWQAGDFAPVVGDEKDFMPLPT